MTDAASADALIAEIERLGARAYPEIGVPAYLVAEDLSDLSLGTAAPPQRAGDLTAALRGMAETIAVQRPELDAATIAQLMEVLADRHFLAADLSFSRTDHLHPAPER